MYNTSDETILYQMYVLSAIRAIADAPDAQGITLVRTEKGNCYQFPFSPDPDFVPQAVRTLTEAADPHIRYLIHVWKDHTLDVPAYSLRRALMELLPENQDALMMLAGKNGFRILPLVETM